LPARRHLLVLTLLKFTDSFSEIVIWISGLRSFRRRILTVALHFPIRESPCLEVSKLFLDQLMRHFMHDDMGGIALEETVAVSTFIPLIHLLYELQVDERVAKWVEVETLRVLRFADLPSLPAVQLGLMA